MSQIFTLPDLGEGLTEAGIVQWLVAVGDRVERDAPIVEVETAKSTVEIPSPFAGIVQATHGTPGDTLLVGQPLIEVDDASAPAAAPAAGATHPDAERYREEERAGSGSVLIGFGTSGENQSQRRRARRGDAAPAVAPAAAPAPTSPAAPAAAPPPSTGTVPLVSSPLVRRLARERGIDVHSLVPSGSDGVIRRADVERAAASAHTPATALPAAPQGAAGVDERTGLAVLADEPLGMFRAAVSRTLGRSRAEIPEATVWVDVDVTRLIALRSELAAFATARGEAKPGYTALIGLIALRQLTRFPELATRFDAERQSITRFDGVNLGFAADTPRGLVVPSVERADRLGLAELHAEMSRLTVAAREGKTTPAELSRGTFTINNYGVFGVDGSAAIINFPEVAILGFGRFLPRPWVVDGAIEVRSIAQFSIVFDHRVCDGRVAGGFLRAVADAVENPAAGLLLGAS